MKHGAITGNLGSGKTTVAKIFELLGVKVYYSDSRAKKLMSTDPRLQKQIIKLLGKGAYNSRQLNREYVARRIFNSPELLKRMNAIVHPAVRRDYILWRRKQRGSFTLQESALTFEIGAEDIMDFTIVVYAPEEILISRGMARDNATREEIVKRLRKQMNQEEKVERATYSINNGGEKSIINQILNIYHKITVED